MVGTWKLNLAKSTFGGGPALKSQIRTYSQSARGITLKMKTVSADGKETTTQTTYQLNGKDHPSMGNPDFDSLSGMQIDTNTAEFTLKRAGKPVGKIRRTVSKDGQTLTINLVITNAMACKYRNSRCSISSRQGTGPLLARRSTVPPEAGSAQTGFDPLLPLTTVSYRVLWLATFFAGYGTHPRVPINRP